MFYAAPKGHYTCYLLPNTGLPMLDISDAIRAILQLMQAPAYNLHGLSFSPRELEAEIQKRYPDFRCTYEPDFRQKLAESWPESIDDTMARQDWGWQPQYDLPRLAQVMFEVIAQSVRSRLRPILITRFCDRGASGRK
jgi:nucleoside-diphosphate-sugar epimerase